MTSTFIVTSPVVMVTRIFLDRVTSLLGLEERRLRVVLDVLVQRDLVVLVLVDALHDVLASAFNFRLIYRPARGFERRSERQLQLRYVDVSVVIFIYVVKHFRQSRYLFRTVLFPRHTTT